MCIIQPTVRIHLLSVSNHSLISTPDSAFSVKSNQELQLEMNSMCYHQWMENPAPCLLGYRENTHTHTHTHTHTEKFYLKPPTKNTILFSLDVIIN